MRFPCELIEGYKYFRFLDQSFPGSVFILPTRDVEAWIRSRLGHGNGHTIKTYLGHTGLDSVEELKDYWRRDWYAHHAAVREYFAGGGLGKLVVFDIDAPDFDALSEALAVRIDPSRWKKVGSSRGRLPGGRPLSGAARDKEKGAS